NGALRVWEVDTGRETVLKGHNWHYSCLEFSPDSRLLATANWDGTLKIWDVALGAEIKSFVAETKPFRCAAFAADGLRLAAGAQDGIVKIYDLQSLHELAAYNA